MTKWSRNLVRYLTLTAITVMAVGIMAWVSVRDDDAARRAREQLTTPVPVAAQARPLVAVETVEASLHEITSKFSGKIRPWETYSIGFEQAGRIVELGTDKHGKPLDDGSRVTAGQTLARIDDRILQARRTEASANLEQASSDLVRAREVRNGGFGGITEAEFQEALTSQALAKAALDIASKNLQDAVLTAPVDGTISRRMAEPGEMVSANSIVFDLVQNDDLLLIVDVPESNINELQSRMRAVQMSQAANSSDAESRVFRARVLLESRDRFGRKLPTIDAEVYRIAELADMRTGLFEVEIRVPNKDRLLRPGMVATAEVVVDRISAYRVPESAVLFRGQNTYVFGLANIAEPLHVMFWQVGEVPLQKAKRILLAEWVDQGDHLLVPSTSVKLNQVVVRGQQRLSDGQHIRVADDNNTDRSHYASPNTDDNAASKKTS